MSTAITIADPSIQIETILEKGSGTANEDTLFMSGNLFGVFDGATSIDGTVHEGGRTGGLLAATTASRIFSANHLPLRRLAMAANQAINDRMIKCGVDPDCRTQLWSTSAAVIRLHSGYIEWVQTGDANIILFYNDGQYRLLADREDHDYQTLSKWKMVSGHHKGTIYEVLGREIRRKRMEMNRTYGVLNGEANAEAFLLSGVVSLAGVTDILIFTDGLSLPSENPSPKRGYDDLVYGFRKLGLAGLKERIRETENTDPECRRFPRFKCHDDIAAIALGVFSDETALLPDKLPQHVETPDPMYACR